MRAAVESDYLSDLVGVLPRSSDQPKRLQSDNVLFAILLFDLCTLYTVIYTDPYVILCMSSVLRDELKKQVSTPPLRLKWTFLPIVRADSGQDTGDEELANRSDSYEHEDVNNDQSNEEHSDVICHILNIRKRVISLFYILCAHTVDVVVMALSFTVFCALV